MRRQRGWTQRGTWSVASITSPLGMLTLATRSLPCVTLRCENRTFAAERSFAASETVSRLSFEGDRNQPDLGESLIGQDAT